MLDQAKSATFICYVSCVRNYWFHMEMAVLRFAIPKYDNFEDYAWPTVLLFAISVN